MKKALTNFLGKIKGFFSGAAAAVSKKFKKEDNFLSNKKPGNNFIRGIVLGLIAALIIVVILVVIMFIFGPKKTQTGTQGQYKVLVITKRNCPECWDTNLLINALKDLQINLDKPQTTYLDWWNFKANSLVKKYKIEKVPTIILTGDFDNNKTLKDILVNIGTIDKNTFVLTRVIPPYLELKTGKLRGQVAVTFLTDTSCKECYDPKVHEVALKNLGVPTTNQKSIDVSSDEGKKLIDQYKIKLVPTVIVTGDVTAYESLTSVWSKVGSVESDGAYIFRSLEVMGTYK
ncbi:MAG: hypothetical protein WC517_04750, partial [Patescibacteria group bacterium]